MEASGGLPHLQSAAGPYACSPAHSLIAALRLHVQRGIQPLTVVVDDAGGVSVTPPMIQVATALASYRALVLAVYQKR